MPINRIITRFSHTDYSRESFYAWAEPADSDEYSENAQKSSEILTFFVAANSDFSVGDYVCAELSEFPLSDETLQNFLENVPHYKISEIKKFLRPSGELHHLEITAARGNR
jgi:hypothetical protein